MLSNHIKRTHSDLLAVSNSWLSSLGFPLCIAVVIAFTVIGTGLATDDFQYLVRARSLSFWDRLSPANTDYVSIPVLHYTHAWIYHLVTDSILVIGLFKAIYLFLFWLACYGFFANFVDRSRAMLAATLFALSPIHDGATIWFTGQYLMLAFMFYLFAATAAFQGRLGMTMALAFLGSFSSYGSPPIAFGLALIFVLQRDWKSTAALVMPNLIYIVYYVYTSVLMKAGISRVPDSVDGISLLKRFIAQGASYFDAGLGPSAFMKFWYSIGSLGVLSACVATVAVFACLSLSAEAEKKPERRFSLWLCGLALFVGGLLTFALTGKYPQMAFSLANRVTIYGNFFLGILAITLLPARALSVLAAISVVAFIGLGEHWRKWEDESNQIVTNLRYNSGIQSLTPDKMLFVTGRQFSHLGPYSHIDHFTSNNVVRDVMNIAYFGKPPTSQYWSLNARSVVSGGDLTDIKYGDKTRLPASVPVYNTDTNEFRYLPLQDFRELVSGMHPDIRHWTQLVSNPQVQTAIVYLMPSLRYAYEKHTNEN